MLPVIAGAFRLEQLSGMSDAMPANPRFSPMPLPVVLHIVSATVFATLGPLQFAGGFRRRWPTWHRVAGRLLVGCGLLVALTGLWMTLFYAAPDGSGALLFISRIVFGSAMVVSIVVGLAAILRRDIQDHRLWMSRGYAIGLGAATQMLVLMLAGIVAGTPNELTHDSLMALSWVINLSVVEWAIRRRRAPRRRTTKPSAAHVTPSLSSGDA
jgi:MFS family permease